MKWISIKKRRPSLGQEVLCYYRGTRYDQSVYAGYKVLYYLKYKFDTRKRVFSEKSIYFHDLKIGETSWSVTHWMPLTSPNKIKEETNV